MKRKLKEHERKAILEDLEAKAQIIVDEQKVLLNQIERDKQNKDLWINNGKWA